MILGQKRNIFHSTGLKSFYTAIEPLSTGGSSFSHFFLTTPKSISQSHSSPNLSAFPYFFPLFSYPLTSAFPLPLNQSSFPPRTSSFLFLFIMLIPFCLTLCILLSRSLYLALCAAIPHCFPKGFTLKLGENIQAWNSPERFLNAHLLFHFQDETRALILKNPACPDGSLRQWCLHPSLAFSFFPLYEFACLLFTILN